MTWDSMKCTPLPQQQQHGPDARASPPTWPGLRSACSARGTAPCASYRFHVAQSALISSTRRTGDPLAGRRLLLRAEQLHNRAIQAKRQPCFSFKPFIYSAAHGQRLHRRQPGQRCADRVRRRVPGQGLATERTTPIPSSARSRCAKPLYKSATWRLDPRLQAWASAGDQLHHQVRLPARRTAAQLLPGPGYRDSHTDGNRRRLERIPANGGYKVNPYVIERIESRDGQVLYQANPPRVPVEEQVAARMRKTPGVLVTPSIRERRRRRFDRPSKSPPRPRPPSSRPRRDHRCPYRLYHDSMLRDVIKRGTGRRALALKRTDLAGKTGTTNDPTTVAGRHNSDYVTSVWVGLTSRRPWVVAIRRYRRAAESGSGAWASPSRTSRCTPCRAARHRQPAHRPVTSRSAAPGTPGVGFSDVQERGYPPSVNEPRQATSWQPAAG